MIGIPALWAPITLSQSLTCTSGETFSQRSFTDITVQPRSSYWRMIRSAPSAPSWGVGCHNARKLSLGWVSRDRQAALWYSLISPLTVVRRLIRAVMLMALPGSCVGG